MVAVILARGVDSADGTLMSTTVGIELQNEVYDDATGHTTELPKCTTRDKRGGKPIDGSDAVAVAVDATGSGVAVAADRSVAVLWRSFLRPSTSSDGNSQ
jgi:hypothetical protein